MRTRGVDPDVDLEDADKERLTRIILKMTENGGYHEGDHSDRLLKWLLGIATAALLAAGSTLWSTSIGLAEVRTSIIILQQQLNRLEERGKTLYRGGSESHE